MYVITPRKRGSCGSGSGSGSGRVSSGRSGGFSSEWARRTYRIEEVDVDLVRSEITGISLTELDRTEDASNLRQVSVSDQSQGVGVGRIKPDVRLTKNMAQVKPRAM
jgi:hypothetical protein